MPETAKKKVIYLFGQVSFLVGNGRELAIMLHSTPQEDSFGAIIYQFCSTFVF